MSKRSTREESVSLTTCVISAWFTRLNRRAWPHFFQGCQTVGKKTKSHFPTLTRIVKWPGSQISTLNQRHIWLLCHTNRPFFSILCDCVKVWGKMAIALNAVKRDDILWRTFALLSDTFWGRFNRQVKSIRRLKRARVLSDNLTSLNFFVTAEVEEKKHRKIWRMSLSTVK